MTAKITASADGTYGSLGVGANEAFRFGADNSGQLASFRNKLINGGFDIWQRGSSGTLSAGGVDFTADRWFVTPYGAALTWSTLPYGGIGNNNNGYQSLGLSGAAGNIGTDIIQRIEQGNCNFLAGNKVTVSVYVNSTSVGRPITAYVRRASAPNNFSAPILVQSITKNMTVGASTWERMIFNFDVLPQEVGNGVEIIIGLGAITAGQVVIVDAAQFEEGSIATPFEQRPIGLELSLCQRYYIENNYVQYEVFLEFAIVNSTVAKCVLKLPCTMRIPPTHVITGGLEFLTGGTITDVVTDVSNVNQIVVNANGTFSLSIGAVMHLRPATPSGSSQAFNAEL
jgi:hypothetical protein